MDYIQENIFCKRYQWRSHVETKGGLGTPKSFGKNLVDIYILELS